MICEKRSSTSNNWFDRAKMNSIQGTNPISTDLWRIFCSTHIRNMARAPLPILIFTINCLNGMININPICASLMKLNIWITSNWTRIHSPDVLMISNMKQSIRHLMMSSRIVQQLRIPPLMIIRRMKTLRRVQVGEDRHAHARLFPSSITVSWPPHRLSTDSH